MTSLNNYLNMLKSFPDKSYIQELYSNIRIYNTIKYNINNNNKTLSVIDYIYNDSDYNNEYKYINTDSCINPPYLLTKPSIINSLSLGIYFTKYKAIENNNNNRSVLDIISGLCDDVYYYYYY